MPPMVACATRLLCEPWKPAGLQSTSAHRNRGGELAEQGGSGWFRERKMGASRGAPSGWHQGTPSGSTRPACIVHGCTPRRTGGGKTGGGGRGQRLRQHAAERVTKHRWRLRSSQGNDASNRQRDAQSAPAGQETGGLLQARCCRLQAGTACCCCRGAAPRRRGRRRTAPIKPS